MTMISTSHYGGESLGTVGPVHPIIAEDGARQGNPITDEYQGGLFGVKTLWYSKSSYQGPVLIRGQRLDAAGTVAFGDGPQFGFLADSGVPSGTPSAGVRTWPGGMYVAAPGCYGFQVDGTSFSYQLVLNIRVPQPN